MDPNIYSIGFMQGRLSAMVDNKIQAFPWENWTKEFEIANKYSLKIMEWTIDADSLVENPLMTKEGREKIIFLKNKFNLSIPSLTGDCFMQQPFWKADGINQQNLQEKFLNVCQCASNINIKYIVLPLVDNGSLNQLYEEKRLIDFLCKIKNKLIQLDLKIVFETDYNPTKCLQFINKLDKNVFGINYDMGNSASLGFDPEEEISLMHNRIWNVHVKDRIYNGSTVALGKGDVDFEKVFFCLSKYHYHGNFILQTARSENNDHEKAILKYRDFVLNYLRTD